jgi:ABC-2 type transport system permease protein
MKKIRFFYTVISTLVKDRMYYPGRLFSDMIVMFARCGVLLLLYAYVFRLRDGVVNDVTYDVVAWSMFFFFAFGLLNLRELSRMIMQDVRTGAVEPISYIQYRLVWQIGTGIFSFVVISMIGGMILAFVIGIPETMRSWFFVGTFAATFMCATVLSFLVYGIIGYMAFWIEDINPIHWLVDKTIMVLGGSYLPIALFPPIMYKIAVFSPFGAVNFITHTTYASWQSQWYILIGIQLFWIIVCGVVLYVINDRAQKRVSINGG